MAMIRYRHRALLALDEAVGDAKELSDLVAVVVRMSFHPK